MSFLCPKKTKNISLNQILESEEKLPTGFNFASWPEFQMHLS